MASAARRTADELWAAVQARTLKDDIDSLTSGDRAPTGAISLLARLDEGPIDCADVVLEPMGAAALVVALRTLPRNSAVGLCQHIRMLSLRFASGVDMAPLGRGLSRLREAGIVPALCGLLTAEPAPPDSHSAADGSLADGDASPNFVVSNALLVATTQFRSAVGPKGDTAEAAAFRQAAHAGAIPHMIAQIQQLTAAAALPAAVVLYKIARVVQPLPADMRTAVQPLLQLLRRPELWRTAADTCGTAARALAFAAAEDAAIASELRAAGAIALATPMLTADLPPAVAAGAAALIEHVALSDPVAGLAAAIQAGTIKPLVRWLRVPAAPDLNADFAAGCAALALTALGSTADLAVAKRLQKQLWAADAAPAALQLLQRRAGNARMAGKAATVLAKAAGGNPTAQDEAIAGGTFGLLRPWLADLQISPEISGAALYCVAELCRDNEKGADAAIAADLVQFFKVLLRRPELQHATSYAIRCMGSSSERAAAMFVGDSQVVKMLAALLLLPSRPGCTPAALNTAGQALLALEALAAVDTSASRLAGVVRPAVELLLYDGDDGGLDLHLRALLMLAYLIKPQGDDGEAAAARNAEVAVAAGALPPVCQILLQPRREGSAHNHAAYVLEEVAELHSAEVVAAGGLLGLVRLLQRPQLPPPVAAAAVRAVGSICKGQPAHQAALCGIGGVSALTEQIRRPLDEGEQLLVVQTTIRVMMQLTEESEAINETFQELNSEAAIQRVFLQKGGKNADANFAAFKRMADEALRALGLDEDESTS